MASCRYLDFPQNTGATGQGTAQRSPARPLRVALINNMPDAAFHLTEQHFCNLLGPASSGMVVELKFYSLPGVIRSAPIDAHIGSFYENFSSLAYERPDGLIVTGMEPGTVNLAEEPFWRAMVHIIDLAEEQAIPSIWSCLAAHAFVLHVDGIQRERLASKLSGVFECRIAQQKHQLLHRMPQKWAIPHSRQNGLSHKVLEQHGYTILSSSRAAGIDIFCRQTDTLQLFLHGHPEYTADTLAREYRRDVLRAVSGAATGQPVPPANLGDQTARALLRQLSDKMIAEGSLGALASFDALVARLRPQHEWASAAQNLMSNWLAYIDFYRGKTRRHAGVDTWRVTDAGACSDPTFNEPPRPRQVVSVQTEMALQPVSSPRA